MATHYYRSTAIVLAYPRFRVELIFRSKISQGQAALNHWLQGLIQKVEARTSGDDSLALDDLSYAVDCVLEHNDAKIPRHEGAFGAVAQNVMLGTTLDLCAKAAVLLEDDDQLLGIVEQCKEYEPGVFYWIGRAASQQMIELYAPKYVRITPMFHRLLTRNISVNHAMDKLKINKIVHAIAQVNSGLLGREFNIEPDMTKPSKELGSLAQAKICNRLSTCDAPLRSDGTVIPILCRWFPELVEPR